MKKIMLIIVLCCLLPSLLYAQTYWVDDNGSQTDINSCSGASPLSGSSACTYGALLDAALSPGDTIYYREGSYSVTSGDAISCSVSGDPGNRITYSAYNDESVTFTSTDSGDNFAVDLHDGGDASGINHIMVTGMTFINFNRHLWIYGGDYNEISYCLFSGYTNESTVNGNWAASRLMRAAQYNHIHHNKFEKYGEFSYAGGCSYSGGDDNGNVFEIGHEDVDEANYYNVIEDNEMSGGGHHVVGWHNKYCLFRNNYIHNEAWWPMASPCNGNRNFYGVGMPGNGGQNLVEGNRIGYGGDTSEGTQCGGAGVTMDHPDNIFRHNMVYQTQIYGLLLSSYSGRTSGMDNKIYNNTFWHNGYAQSSIAGKNCFSNSITHAVVVGDIVGSTDNNAFINNLFWDNQNLINPSWPIVESYNGGTGWNEPENQIIRDNWNQDNGDPSFVSISGTPDPENKTQFDFSLQSTSRAIDNGGRLTDVASADDCNGGTGCDTTVAVENAGFFFDGWGIAANVPTATIEADWVCISAVSNCAQITSIDYDADIITLSSALNRNDGDDVWLYKDSFGNTVLHGSAPDQGAHEHVDSPSNTGGNDNSSGGGCFVSSND